VGGSVFFLATPTKRWSPQERTLFKKIRDNSCSKLLAKRRRR
jgi:hypothetical protein